MRWVTVTLTALASIATILAYLHLEPEWVANHWPHLTWKTPPGNEAVPTSGTIAPSRPQTPAEPTPQPPSYLAAFQSARQAAHRHDYAGAVADYQSALDAPDITLSEKAAAYDAMGYALMRAELYDRADAALGSALAIEPITSARVNQIKVKCGRGEPAATVVAALELLRQEKIADAKATSDIETDKELFKDCAYAGIQSRQG